MGEVLTNPWKELIDSEDDFQLYLKKFQSEEEYKEEEEEEEESHSKLSHLSPFSVQESIYPSDPLLEFIQCNECKKLVPLKSFENHITCTKECGRLIREENERKEWDEMENKKKKGRTILEEDEEAEKEEVEDEEAEDEEAEDEEAEEEDEPQTIYSEEWVRRFERLSLPAELNKDCDPPNCSETVFASVPYYIHIHCGVMKSDEPCKYFMTRCPIHNPIEEIKVPGRNFIEDYQKLKSAYEKILLQPKELNSKFCCGLITKQGVCMEFLFSCNHLFNERGEVRQEDILKLIQGLIEIDPSLKKISTNYRTGKRRENHIVTKSRRLKDVILSHSPDDEKDNNDSHMETDESNDSTSVFSSSFAPKFSNDKKYYFQRINLDFRSTPQPDPLWKAFEMALKRTLQKDLLTLSNSDDDSEESMRED